MAGGVTQAQGVVANDPTIAAITGGNTWFVPSGGSSGAAVSVPADTTEDILVTVNLPILSATSQIRIQGQVVATNNTNVKTIRARLGGIGGTIFLSPPFTSTTGGGFWGIISNAGATNAQVCNVPGGAYHPLGASVAPNITGAIDTSVATTLVITGQKATAGDTLTLQHYLIEVLRP